MMSQSVRSTVWRRAGMLAVAGSLLAVTGLYAARPTTPPVAQPVLNPKADAVQMFDGIEQGQLEVTMIPSNSLKGNLLIENKTGKPMTVQMPESIVGVQILKQYGGGGAPGAGGFGGGAAGGGGGGQGVGGGGIGGGGGFGGGGGGGGFFSIPPDKVVRLSYRSVCLEHGKAEPSPRMKYRPVRVSDYTKDPALQELLLLVGTEQIDPQVAQAAAWHIANKMSWDELANKAKSKLAGRFVPYFSHAELTRASQLVSLSVGRAREKQANQKEESAAAETDPPVRTRQPLEAQ